MQGAFAWEDFRKGGGIVARLSNIRQEAFCQAYSKSGNATEAYKEAGYKPKSDKAAQVCASKLLSNAIVANRLKELGDVKEKSTIADAQEQQEFFASVLRGEIAECNGKPASLNVRLKAAELLGKMQGCYINHVETNVSVQPVVIRDDLGESS